MPASARLPVGIRYFAHELRGRRHQSDSRMFGAILAELSTLLFHLLQIKNSRCILIGVVTVEPRHHEAHALAPAGEEILARESREIDRLCPSRRSDERGG